MVAELGCSTASAVMAEYVQRVGEQPSELLVEEWNLLSAIYKNAVGNRRAAWRVITSVEQKETSKGDEKLVSNAREYVEKVESELQKIRDGILALVDKNLVPSPSTDETKVSYYKMKSDYYRYLAEQATEVPKTSSRDRTLQCAAEQNPNVPVPEMVTQLLEVAENHTPRQNPAADGDEWSRRTDVLIVPGRFQVLLCGHRQISMDSNW